MTTEKQYLDWEGLKYYDILIKSLIQKAERDGTQILSFELVDDKTLVLTYSQNGLISKKTIDLSDVGYAEWNEL